MTSAYHDYQQFLGWLYQPGRGAPEDVFRFANMIRCLEVVLGVQANNLVWLYLNKGTHEEANRDDYDAGVVQTVLETFEAMARLRFERVRA